MEKQVLKLHIEIYRFLERKNNGIILSMKVSSFPHIGNIACVYIYLEIFIQ